MSPAPDVLHVWLGGSLAADLTIGRRRVPKLRYRQEFVEERGEGALGLSIPLPVTRKPYSGELVDFWVEGLLPEGETRTVLERYFRVRRGDGFTLLAALGRDCAGAVAVVPPGEAPVAPGVLPRALSAAEVDEAVMSLRQHPLGVDEDVRVSLGGLQSKLLLVETADGWARPGAGAPSTHILKPDPPEYPGLVASEAFAQRAAGLAGLPAAQVRLDTFGGRTVLVVTRFDRIMAGGVLTRVHQEDGCQALGLEPSGLGKYQSSDGLASYRRLAAVLAEHSHYPADELRRLAAIMTFTVAIGNTDAHLRNHAFLHGTGTVSLAPIFDAAPAAQVARTRQLALWVDEQSILTFVTYKHLIREMAYWGLTEDSAGEVADATLTALADSYAEAARAVPEVSPGIVADCETRTEILLRHR